MCLSDVLLLLLFLPVGGTGWAGTATLQLDDTDRVVYKQILRFGHFFKCKRMVVPEHLNCHRNVVKSFGLILLSLHPDPVCTGLRL